MNKNKSALKAGLCLVCLAILLQVRLAVADSQGSLELQPAICVLSSSESRCRDNVDVRWQTPQQRSVCLRQATQPDRALDCWQDQREGESTVAVDTDVNLRFELIDSSDESLVASREFQVIREQQRLRQRRRNPWNFF